MLCSEMEKRRLYMAIGIWRKAKAKDAKNINWRGVLEIAKISGLTTTMAEALYQRYKALNKFDNFRGLQDYLRCGEDLSRKAWPIANGDLQQKLEELYEKSHDQDDKKDEAIMCLYNEHRDRIESRLLGNVCVEDEDQAAKPLLCLLDDGQARMLWDEKVVIEVRDLIHRLRGGISNIAWYGPERLRMWYQNLVANGQSFRQAVVAYTAFRWEKLLEELEPDVINFNLSDKEARVPESNVMTAIFYNLLSVILYQPLPRRTDLEDTIIRLFDAEILDEKDRSKEHLMEIFVTELYFGMNPENFFFADASTLFYVRWHCSAVLNQMPFLVCMETELFIRGGLYDPELDWNLEVF